MITVSTNMTNALKRANIPKFFVCKIETATDDIYISTKEYSFSSGQRAIGVISEVSPISSMMSVFSRTIASTDMSIGIMNAPYNMAGTIKRFSDFIGGYDYINRPAKVYLCADNITSFSDCLLLFNGYISEMITADPNKVTLKLTDITMRFGDVSGDVAGSSSYPQIDNPTTIPIVFGTVKPNEEIIGRLVKGIYIGSKKFVISNEPMKSVSDVWIYDNDFGCLARFTNSSDYGITLDDSGRTTVRIYDYLSPELEVYLYPDSSEIIHNDSPYYVLTDSQLAHDKNDKTYMTASVASYTPDGHTDDTHEDIFYATLPSHGASGEFDNVYLEWKHERIEPSSTYYQAAWWRFQIYSGSSWHDYPSSQIEGRFTTLPGYNSADITSSLNSDSRTISDLKDPARIKVIVQGGFRSGDGSRRTLGYFHECRLRIKYKKTIFQRNPYSPYVVLNVPIYVSGEGRKFGSWIDETGRSNSYDEGDLIENPAYIIESILRSNLGLDSSGIDVDAFDNAASELSSWKNSLVIDESVKSHELIADICRQNKLLFYTTGKGTCSLFCFKSSYTASATLYADDILGNPEISYMPLNALVNRLRINYLLDTLTGKMKRTTSAENTSSQTKYAMTKKAVIDAGCIHDSDTADLLSAHIVGSSGYWKDLKIILSIETTLKLCHWDVGDIIAIDSSLDSYLMKLGASWADTKMLIIEKNVYLGRCYFRLIEI